MQITSHYFIKLFEKNEVFVNNTEMHEVRFRAIQVIIDKTKVKQNRVPFDFFVNLLDLSTHITIFLAKTVKLVMESLYFHERYLLIPIFMNQNNNKN